MKHNILLRASVLAALVMASQIAGAAVITTQLSGVFNSVYINSAFDPNERNAYPFPAQPFLMSLTGSVTYDNTTNTISALSLSQVGSTAPIQTATGFGPDAPFTDGGTFTYSNFSWVLGSNALGQTLSVQTGAVSCFSPVNVSGVCSSPHFGLGAWLPPAVSEVSFGGSGEGSGWDFNGVPSGFSVFSFVTFTPKNISAYTSRPGMAAAFNPDGSITLSLVGTTGDLPADVVNNTIVLGSMNLTQVPLPATVWLFASAIGLIGGMRRALPVTAA